MTESEEARSRTELLLGQDGVLRLSRARVAVFGVGGVGGYVTEALARAGVGALDLVDYDTVSISNINRQLCALRSTVGRYKVDVFAERIADIDPEIKVRAYKIAFSPETAAEFDFSVYDYVVDAIDQVSGKLALAECAKSAGVPIISSMGAGNKLDPTKFRAADIFETTTDPLARVMRRELRRRGIEKLRVVYSTEPPIPCAGEAGGSGRPVPGSVSFVPSAAGLVIAGEVIRALAGVGEG